jgi:hypothetical protein
VGLFLAPVSPMRPLLPLTTHAGDSVAAAVGLLAGAGAVLTGLTAYLAARLP